MPDLASKSELKAERWGAVMLGACIGFGFVFGSLAAQLVWRGAVKLFVLMVALS